MAANAAEWRTSLEAICQEDPVTGDIVLKDNMAETPNAAKE